MKKLLHGLFLLGMLSYSMTEAKELPSIKYLGLSHSEIKGEISAKIDKTSYIIQKKDRKIELNVDKDNRIYSILVNFKETVTIKQVLTEVKHLKFTREEQKKMKFSPALLAVYTSKDDSKIVKIYHYENRVTLTALMK